VGTNASGEGGMFLQDVGIHSPEDITVSKPKYHNMKLSSYLNQ
jgi:hypothetical protein